MDCYKCPHCGGIFHGLRENANCNEEADGSFFFVLKHVAENMWETFEEDIHIKGPNLECPECLQSYADPVTGRLYESSIVEDNADQRTA